MLDFVSLLHRRKNNCQPNFRRRVTPPADRSCGPYKPVKAYGNAVADEETCGWVRGDNHDTISMVAIDGGGRIAAGSSSNGASHKVQWKTLGISQTAICRVHPY